MRKILFALTAILFCFETFAQHDVCYQRFDDAARVCKQIRPLDAPMIDFASAQAIIDQMGKEQILSPVEHPVLSNANMTSQIAYLRAGAAPVTNEQIRSMIQFHTSENQLFSQLAETCSTLVSLCYRQCEMNATPDREHGEGVPHAHRCRSGGNPNGESLAEYIPLLRQKAAASLLQAQQSQATLNAMTIGGQ